uniref:Uncharacterized protein n=1 Tax=viral metagenome TaxID=1070528 RepID=A0A6M3J8I9_9ZZZZ
MNDKSNSIGGQLQKELFRLLIKEIKKGLESYEMGKMYDLLWNADVINGPKIKHEKGKP